MHADNRANQFGNDPSTTAQRDYAIVLMSKIELDTRFLTLMHRRFFEAAYLHMPGPGKRISDVLASLTRSQMSLLLRALKRDTGDDGDES